MSKSNVEQAIAIEPYADGVPLCGEGTPIIQNVADLLRTLATVKKRWGDTCVTFETALKGSWGANALWVLDGKSKEIHKLTDALSDAEARLARLNELVGFYMRGIYDRDGEDVVIPNRHRAELRQLLQPTEDES
jgi:hypothetical protein